MRLTFGVLTVSLFVSGCSQSARVSSNLPLERVVVYRNGVAYFERGGRVAESQVRFKMKEEAVGDFLATLAVMERGGSSVRSAAFPIKSPDDVPECEPNPFLPQLKRNRDDIIAPRLRTCTEFERRHIREVVLSLDGQEHDLSVGYVTEAPVWRPSYRLVIRPDGKAELQAWGIVQNLSGEDWKNVKLTLVAGAPLAFSATLGTPVIPERPTVTDEGEVIAAVPRAETSLETRAAAPPAPELAKDDDGEALADRDEPADAKREKADAAKRPMVLGATGRGPGGGGTGSFGDPLSSTAIGGMKKAGAPAGRAAPASPPPAQAAKPVVPSAPRNLRSLAAVAATTGATRYDLKESVTIPDKSATMVLLLSKRITGEAAFLFAPDGGVPDSSKNPFRVARFANESGGGLEKGPIAVFDESAFVGQGMVDPLPSGATATVPFALDRSLSVERDTKYDERGERVFKIENGQLMLERDRVTLSKYKIRNGSERSAKIYVKHGRNAGARLEAPPQGTEDNVGTGFALVPTTVNAKADRELVIEERQSFQRYEDWFTPIAEKAVHELMDKPGLDSIAKKHLTEAWRMRVDIVSMRQQASAYREQAGTLSSQSEDTRRNLKAIEKNQVAAKLRDQLTKRLEELSKKSDEVGKKLVEVQAKLAELEVRFKEELRDVRYVSVGSK